MQRVERHMAECFGVPVYDIQYSNTSNIDELVSTLTDGLKAVDGLELNKVDLDTKDAIMSCHDPSADYCGETLEAHENDLVKLDEEFCNLGIEMRCEVSKQYIRVPGTPKLQALPEAIGGLASLKGLVLSRCSSLRTLPEAFGRLASLE